MEKTDCKYQMFVEILKRELVPATGCTEPIALAYCAAKARAALGAIPERVRIEASGNVVKNVKSVIVPHTAGKRGIATAAAIGILAGDAERGLEVLADADISQETLENYLKTASFEVATLKSGHSLDIVVKVYHGTDEASARVTGRHTTLVRVEKNGETLFERSAKERKCSAHGNFTLKEIYDFATTAELSEIAPVLDRQIDANGVICEEGLKHPYGANIGTVLMKFGGDGVRNRAKARAAAGSDARMNGCELPVVINSGSGNQGITVSIPVVEYAKELNVAKETLYRALILSNLIAVHLKSGIGTLSAYCGAISAGAAAGAGIAFLHGADLEAISHTVVNALAITSGIVCDGAKASCAAKIATAVDAGIFGYEMVLCGQRFCGGDGIVSSDPEGTIRNIGYLAGRGMRETDKEILHIMTCYD